MGRRIFYLLAPFLLLGACQAIADLTIPTYESTSGASSGSGSGGDGAAGGSTATGVGGDGGRVQTGQGGKCTSQDPTKLPPCLEHLRLWLNAARKDLTHPDSHDRISTWDDQSSFGWVANAVSGADVTRIPDASAGHDAVHLANGGMKLDAHSVPLPLPEVALFGAIRWVEFPPETGVDQANFPFGTADILCLSTIHAIKPKLQFQVQNQAMGQSMPGVRFHWDVEDGVAPAVPRVIDHELPTAVWQVYAGQYRCDDTCATDAGGAQDFAAVDGQASDAGPVAPPSLDRKQWATWHRDWDIANLGSDCDGKAAANADIGELLLYDAILDDEMLLEVDTYLSNRWHN